MTIRTFVWGSGLVTVVTSAIWAMIIVWLNPYQAGWIGFVLFFLALFLAIASLASLVGYGIRRLVIAEQLPAYRVRYSVRQGGLLGLLAAVLMGLQLARVARWWLVLIVVVLFVTTEFIFLSYDRAAERYRYREE